MNQMINNFKIDRKLELAEVNQHFQSQVTLVETDDKACDKTDFARAMGSRVSTVNLVTTDGVAGRFGLTVTSMCSVSMEPPTVMIGINKKSPLCLAISKNKCFVINVLSIAQQHIAENFSGNSDLLAAYSFPIASWKVEQSGAPILYNSAATLECSLISYQHINSHLMFAGRVINSETSNLPPLCYGKKKYQYAKAI